MKAKTAFICGIFIITEFPQRRHFLNLQYLLPTSSRDRRDVSELFTKTSQKVVTKSSPKLAQKLLHELQTAILSTQKRNSHEIKLQK